MTEPTNEALDLIMAEHMGWHWDHYSEGWYDEHDILQLQKEWHPSENMNQAMVCFDAYANRRILPTKLLITRLPSGSYDLKLGRWGVWVQQQPFARAICLAIWQA